MSAKAGVLFVARVKGTDICRIGYSRELDARIQVLKKHCHREIDITQTLDLDGSCDGTAVIDHLRSLVAARGEWLRGDWYRLDQVGMRTCLMLVALEFKD